MTFRFIHAADIHLDSPLRGLERYEGAPVEQVRGAVRKAFHNLVTFSINENVDFVLIAGDLFDRDWPDYNTGLFFVNQMVRLKEHGIPVFVIKGNHDAASQISKRVPLPENVTELSVMAPETVRLDHLGVAIHGQGFRQQAVTDDLSLSYPEPDKGFFNIGLLHTCASGREGHEPYAPCAIESLVAKSYQYWALGHVHKREIISTNPWIVFPGNIQGRHIRETGVKGCSLVTVQDNEVLSVDHVPLDVLRWTLCPVDGTGCSTPESIVQEAALALEQVLEQGEDYPLAVRFVIRNARCGPNILINNQEEFVRSIQAMAIDTGLRNVWVEKVKFENPPEVSSHSLDDMTTSFVWEYIQKLANDDQELENILAELGQLKKALPSSVATHEDVAPFLELSQVRSTLPEIQRLIQSLIEDDKEGSRAY